MLSPETFAVEILLSEVRMRGALPGLRFNRLSDLLQNLHEDFMTLHAVSVEPLHPAGRRWNADEVQIARHEILLVVATDSGGTSDPSEVIPKVTSPVDLVVGPWQVTGTIHTLERVRPLDFLITAHGMFFPITEAAISSAVGDTSKAQLVVANGRRLFAFSRRATPP